MKSTAGWIGLLPQGWDLVPSKAIFEERREPNWTEDVHLTPSQIHGVLPQSEYTARTGNSVVQNLQGQDSMKHVEPDDFIIHLRSFQGGIERSTYSGKVSTAYTVLAPKRRVFADYFRWLLKSDGYVQELRTTTNQLRDGQSIKFRDFAKVPLPLPPVGEQHAIANYLDRETARIDTLIEEQQRLIEMLRERRMTVVAQAATRGIDVAPLVDSGNVYLGDIPAHWTVSRFSREMAVNGGQVDPRDDPWADMILVAPNHIESGTGRIVGRETAREQGADSGKYVAKAGQILYSKIRPALNKVAVASEDCLTSADMYAMSSRREDSHRYLMYFMLASPFHAFVTLASLRVKMPKVNRGELGEAPFLRPPLDEQRRIAEFLDEQTSMIDALTAETQRFIELARERRSALITAAVMGQIDVRSTEVE